MAKTKKAPKPKAPKTPTRLGSKKVPDPWEPGRYLTVTCNQAESPIELLASRGKLNGAQRAAADRYRALYERGQVSPLKGMNTMKEAVDGGGAVSDNMNDSNLQAMRELERIHSMLDPISSRLLMTIVGESAPIGQVSSAYGRLRGDHSNGYTTGRLMEAVDELVRAWGMTAVGPTKAKTVAARGITVTGPTTEWTVGRHGDIVPK